MVPSRKMLSTKRNESHKNMRGTYCLWWIEMHDYRLLPAQVRILLFFESVTLVIAIEESLKPPLIRVFPLYIIASICSLWYK